MLVMLTASEVRMDPDLAKRPSILTCTTNTNCYEYSIKTADDGQYLCPKHVEFFIK